MAILRSAGEQTSEKITSGGSEGSSEWNPPSSPRTSKKNVRPRKKNHAPPEISHYSTKRKKIDEELEVCLESDFDEEGPPATPFLKGVSVVFGSRSLCLM